MGVLTRGRRGRLVLLATVLGLVAALAVILPTPDASGQAPVTIEDDAGVILVSTGPGSGDNWIRYYADPVAPLNVDAYDVQQTINVSNKCGVTNPVGSLLAISETGGTGGIGLISNGYGVKTKNNCSTSQGRIGFGQSLTFELGSFFAHDIEMVLGEVDVEGKFGADLGYTAVGDNVHTATVDLPNTSDNGPDAGGGDNNIAVLDPQMNFRSITFEAVGENKAEVAIEGGGDAILAGEPDSERTALGVNQSLFKLVSVREFDAGDLFCGDTVPATQTNEDGPAEDISLGRGQNLKGDPCVEVAYTFRIESDSVLFDVDLESDEQENANLLVRVDWEPVADSGFPFETPHRQINYFPDDPDSDFEPVVACESLEYDGDIADPLPHPEDVYEHPDDARFEGGVAPWCLAGEQLVLDESGQWQQIQWYDGAGDPRWR